MSKYTKTPKVEVDDVDNENLDGRNYRIPNERTRTGPMPYDIPDQLKEVEVKKKTNQALSKQQLLLKIPKIRANGKQTFLSLHPKPGSSLGSRSKALLKMIIL